MVSVWSYQEPSVACSLVAVPVSCVILVTSCSAKCAALFLSWSHVAGVRYTRASVSYPKNLLQTVGLRAEEEHVTMCPAWCHNHHVHVRACVHTDTHTHTHTHTHTCHTHTHTHAISRYSNPGKHISLHKANPRRARQAVVLQRHCA